ncbi:MAG: SDR family NAD(P)-dependent oxidoreductase [Solirubrobacterales bacterium]
MSGRLDGKTAIVTGAGQTPGKKIGNGRATAITFAREGAEVLAVDIDREAAEATAKEIGDAGGRCEVAVGDVAVPGDCARIVEEAAEQLGGVDVLHHNVGIAAGDGWLEWIELPNWERLMTVNAGGALAMAAAVVPVMKERDGGAIMFVSSIAARVGGSAPMQNPPLGYKMSKAALDALGHSLAQTYAADGIRVNVIAPGLIDTPMGVDSVAEMLGIDRDDYAKARDAAVPLKGGQGSAWDVANAALFLASDEARFITGVLLPVDGGQSTRTG